MEIIIHGSMKRFKYVSEFLSPKIPFALPIFDDEEAGNIKAYMASFKWLLNDRLIPGTNTWHLEDDVLPDKRIHEWMRYAEGTEGIICGFGTTEKFGFVEPEDMWYSFPCIRIPNDYLGDFVQWVETSGDEDVAERMKLGKGIDFLFRKFVVQNPIQIYHTVPCMVEHIDEYIGGSLINDRKEPIKAIRFEDTERLAELKDWVKEN